MKLSMSASRLTFVRPLALAVAGAVLLLSPAPASAQLSRVGGSIAVKSGFIRGTDTAYDPVNDVYLIVMGNGPIYGIFVNPSGQPVTSAFTIFDGSTAFAHFPRAKYSPDVSNGAGGQGGFLVAWHQGNTGVPNNVYVRIVAFGAPGRLVSGSQVISDGLEFGSRWESWPAIAYSRTSRRFLVGWNTILWGIRGRFVDTNGTPTGSVMLFENAGGSREPSIAWNSATDEFGLVYSAFGPKNAWASFRTIGAANGAVSGRTSFGFSAGTFATAIDVNAATNRYVMAWALHPGTMSAVFDQNGTQISTNFVTSRIGFDQSLGLAFNATTGTFLTVGSDGGSLEVGATEINGNGVPMPGYQIVTDGARAGGSNYPLTTARTGTNQWDIVYSRDFAAAANQIVASGSNGAATPTPVPVSAPAPASAPSAPAPSSSGCTTPDPFASIGGGTCVSGGWRPGSTAPALAATATPVAAPAPAPSSSTCTTPDPFVSIGGGTCVGGGWRPGGGGSVGTSAAKTASTAPAASASTCTTADPFASIGGGTCVGGGGWVPGLAGAGGCVGPDPFTSIGGGVCISGGWVPGRR
jgi:hypothetical protein